MNNGPRQPSEQNAEIAGATPDDAPKSLQSCSVWISEIVPAST